MKKTLSALMLFLAISMTLGAIDIVVPRTYAEDGFYLRNEGMPDFRVDETIWKASTQGYTINSVTRTVWEILDESGNRIYVALGAGKLDMKALEKVLSQNGDDLLLLVALDTPVSGAFFEKYPFKYVAMQSYTPDMMKGLRASGAKSYPFSYSDALRVEGDTVEFVSLRDTSDSSLVIEGEKSSADGSHTILVVCPHCGETIKIRI